MQYFRSQFFVSPIFGGYALKLVVVLATQDTGFLRNTSEYLKSGTPVLDRPYYTTHQESQ